MAKTAQEYEEVWAKGNYRQGSTCERLIPLLLQYFPQGCTVNDYGSGTGRAEVILVEKEGFRVNMVDFASNALEDAARALIDGARLTYRVCPLECLPDDFPKAEWGMCINVLMTVDPEKLDAIMAGMRRTCDNLIVETYARSDMRLGQEMTLIKGDAEFWAEQMGRYWPVVESFSSPEHGRTITIGRCK